MAKETISSTAGKKVIKPRKANIKKTVTVGDVVPEFSLPTTGKTETFSWEYLEGQAAILYFYPKDDTSGCTAEGQDFAKNYKKFKALGYEICGVSRDSLKSHYKFKEKYSFPFDLISDENELLCGLFGVMKEKSMYGRKYIGVERSTFVINGKGKIIKEWRGVKVPGHVAEVLAYVKSL